MSYTPSSYSEVRDKFMSKDSVNYVLSQIEWNIGHNLNNNEVDLVYNFMNKQSSSSEFFKQHNSIRACHNVMINYFANLFIDGDGDGTNHEQPIDEMMRDAIKTDNVRWDVDGKLQTKNKSSQLVSCDSFFDLKTPRDFAKTINPFAVAKTYPVLMLDTRNRILNDSIQGQISQFSWTFYVGNNWSQGAVNGMIAPHNIIGIECGTIYLPNITYSVYTEYRQISMFIQEFSEQSSVINANSRFHFLFDVQIISDESGSQRLKLIPAFNDIAELRFTHPINTLSTFTVSFGNPVDNLLFTYDRDLTPGDVIQSPTSEDGTVFTTSFPHGFIGGELVYLESFTTGDVQTDYSIISIANQSIGHTVLNVDEYTFTLNIDTSTCTAPLSVSRIIFGSRRFFIPLKLRYIE